MLQYKIDIYFICYLFAEQNYEMNLLNCRSPSTWKKKMLSRYRSLLVYKPVVDGKYNWRQKCVSCNELNGSSNVGVGREIRNAHRTACTFFNKCKIPAYMVCMVKKRSIKKTSVKSNIRSSGNNSRVLCFHFITAHTSITYFR